MRATSTLAGVAVVVCSSLLMACPEKHPDPEWMKPPAGYDPIGTEGLTLNKQGLDAITLEEGEKRDALVQSLMAPGTFKGQAKCQSGAGTGDLDHSKWGEYELACDAGVILFDIELKYHLFTTRAVGKPLSANAFVEFGGTLVQFDFQDQQKPRSVTAMVQVGEDLRRIEW